MPTRRIHTSPWDLYGDTKNNAALKRINLDGHVLFLVQFGYVTQGAPPTFHRCLSAALHAMLRGCGAYCACSASGFWLGLREREPARPPPCVLRLLCWDARLLARLDLHGTWGCRQL